MITDMGFGMCSDMQGYCARQQSAIFSAIGMHDTAAYFAAKGVPIVETVPETPTTPIWSDGKTRLLEARKGERPILIASPEAGHGSMGLVDYGPGQSILACALENYSGGVYVIEKLEATQDHVHLGIDYIFSSVERILDFIGEPTHGVGLCQGGYQLAVPFADRPQLSLAVVASPIDVSAAESHISRMLEVYPQEYFEAIVAANNGLMPGAAIVSGFMLGNAHKYWEGEEELWDNSRNSAYLARRNRFNNWYLRPKNLPGLQFLETSDIIFRQNDLKRFADLGAIRCPVTLMGGKKDNLVPPAQVFAIKKQCPQAKEVLLDGGHIGCFMGHESISKFWTPYFKGLN